MRTPKLDWDVVDTDRDGKPVERVAALPRVRWPGVYVFDRANVNGRYRVFTADPGDPERLTLIDTGLRFRTLDALWTHLEQDAAPIWRA